MLARNKKAGTAIPSPNTLPWTQCTRQNSPRQYLWHPNALPVRVTETAKPIEINRTLSGNTIVDFGQNLVGRVHIYSLVKPADHVGTLTHAEVLEGQELSTRPLRLAKYSHILISADTEIHDRAPRFTFHCFRPFQINGWTPDDTETHLALNSLVAEGRHTDLSRTSRLTCSQPNDQQIARKGRLEHARRLLLYPSRLSPA